MVNPWFTVADLAEIDVVAKTLEAAIFEHREKCATCCATSRSCSTIVDAFEAALEWSELRMMTSKATALRARRLVEIREMARR